MNSDIRLPSVGSPNPKRNKTPIWEIFEEMRKEMVDTKRAIHSEIEEAKAEKKRIESRLEGITNSEKSAFRWRKLKRSLDFWILQSRGTTQQKMHGIPLFGNRDTDQEKFNKIANLVIHYSQKKKRKNCMLYPDSMVRNYWAYFLVILLIYTIVMVPLTLSVIEIKDSDKYFYLDQTVNVFFALDILVNMRTAIDEERDGCREILVNYASSWLTFDLIAIFPFDLLMEDNKFGLTLLTKVPRFMRLARVFKLLRIGGNIRRNKWYKRFSELVNFSPAAIKLIQFFLTMLVIIHITGCLWLFIAKMDDYGPSTWVFE